MAKRSKKTDKIEPGPTLEPTELIVRTMSCGHVISGRSRQAVEGGMADHLEKFHTEAVN